LVTRFAASVIAVAIVATAAVAAAASSDRVRDLQAWAAINKRPPVGISNTGFSYAPHVVQRLPPGRYRLSIIASDAIGFQLVGPGVNRHTPVTPVAQPHFYATNTTWTIRLRRGDYTYRAIGPYASTVHPASGALRVR
jgi:hypothetical protein